jgi:hypothetical protein
MVGVVVTEAIAFAILQEKSDAPSPPAPPQAARKIMGRIEILLNEMRSVFIFMLTAVEASNGGRLKEREGVDP